MCDLCSTISELSPEIQYHWTESIVFFFALVGFAGFGFKRTKEKRVWEGTAYILLGVWFFTGFLLYFPLILGKFDIKDFISNWVNSAAAIGTIGAVSVALYISGLSKQENLKVEAKKALFIGMEIITQISNLDQLYINYHDGQVDDDKSLTSKILKLQWEVKLIFENDKTSTELLLFVRKLHEKYQSRSLDLLKCFLKENGASSDEVERYTDYSFCYSKFKERLNKGGLNKEYEEKLVELFKKSQPMFSGHSKYYFNMSDKLIKKFD